MPEGWRSRITGSGEEDPTQLVANPKNWRIHPKTQQDALASVLDSVGWVQQVLVNQRTGNVVDGHSTQKPVECMARPIRNHKADAVYDPFIGSGTTIIAAEQEGRRCYAMDIEPKYVQVAKERWEAFTGKEARLDEG